MNKKAEPNKARRVGDVVTKRSEVDKQVLITDILGQDVTIVAVDVLKGDKNDYVFISFNKPNDKVLYGFSCGGMVVVRKLKEVVDKRSLPIIAKFTEVQGNTHSYYDVE